MSDIELSINLDHVATVRQARGGDDPDPVAAAEPAERGGARGFTLHVREDRRHAQDGDLARLRRWSRLPVTLEMACTDEMTALALEHTVPRATLVPESRQELTTEGGLDLVGDDGTAAAVIERLGEAGVRVSCFLDPDPDQVAAAARLGADFVELHTGPWCHAHADAHAHETDEAAEALDREITRLRRAGTAVRAAGLGLNAGHGLNARNVGPVVAALAPLGLRELHVGHALVARSIFTGMEEACAEFLRAVAAGAAAAVPEDPS